MDVVKVEPPGGDPDRTAPPWAGTVPGPVRSLPWLAAHLGKRSMILDLGVGGNRVPPRGADTVVNGPFPASVLARLELSVDMEYVTP